MGHQQIQHLDQPSLSSANVKKELTKNSNSSVVSSQSGANK